MMGKVKAVVFDIDGVLTDGRILIDEEGKEYKTLSLIEMDAFYGIKRCGMYMVAITGEDTKLASFFEKRFPWDVFVKGCKEKSKALNEILDRLKLKLSEICYIGDGRYDIEPIRMAGVGVCPANAIKEAKAVSDIVLGAAGGEGCICELERFIKKLNSEVTNKEVFEASKDIIHMFKKRIRAHQDLFDSMENDSMLVAQISGVAEKILDTLKSSGALYLCGNGGSAVDASHIATEFVSRFYKERKAMNAEALSISASTMTAIGNDYSFKDIFKRQVEAKGHKGDILIGLSTSGTSENVIEASKYAKTIGMFTVLLTGNRGFKGGDGVFDIVIEVPSGDTPRIQEGHMFLGHLLAEYVEEKWSQM